MTSTTKQLADYMRIILGWCLAKEITREGQQIIAEVIDYLELSREDEK